MFTPRPRPLTEAQSHKLVEIYIEDILDDKPVDISKLQYARDFDITIDSNNIFDIISKLLYYRLYRHSNYIHELEIARLLQTILAKLPPVNQRSVTLTQIVELLKTCFGSAINNYANTHLMKLHGFITDGVADELVPQRDIELITAYTRRLAQQFHAVFADIPVIHLDTQYLHWKTVEYHEHQLYLIMQSSGWCNATDEAFERVWKLSHDEDTATSDNIVAVTAAKEAAKQRLLELMSENNESANTSANANANANTNKLSNLIEKYNGDKYDDLITDVKKIKDEIARFASTVSLT